MLYNISIMNARSECAGLPKIDTRARQREMENPPTRDTSVCQCCGREAKPGDLWREEWAYSYTPNKAIGGLAVIAAFTGAALVQYTREVFHNTHHTICPQCAH